MGDVKRYDINAYLGEEGWMEEDRHGQYVEYTDYAKLEAALSSAPQGWRPIETAPKVCDPSILVADVKRQDVWMDWWDEDCEWWANSAEFGLSKPTHWMPLPAAPKSPASEREA